MKRPVAFAACLVVLAGRPLAACDPAWLPIARPPGIAYFIASHPIPTAVGVRVDLARGWAGTTALEPGPVMLIPWAYGPDCTPLPWSESASWQPPGEVAFYTAWLRPRDRWINRLPTFDVRMALREPLWRARDPRWTRPDSATVLLDAAGFLELFAALPTEAELRDQPGRAAEHTTRWAAAHPSVAEREPARTIVANLRRAAGISEQD